LLKISFFQVKKIKIEFLSGNYSQTFFELTIPNLEVYASKISFYRNICLSQYCASKCLVWIRPYHCSFNFFLFKSFLSLFPFSNFVLVNLGVIHKWQEDVLHVKVKNFKVDKHFFDVHFLGQNWNIDLQVDRKVVEH